MEINHFPILVTQSNAKEDSTMSSDEMQDSTFSAKSLVKLRRASFEQLQSSISEKLKSQTKNKTVGNWKRLPANLPEIARIIDDKEMLTRCHNDHFMKSRITLLLHDKSFGQKSNPVVEESHLQRLGYTTFRLQRAKKKDQVDKIRAKMKEHIEI